MAPFIIVLLHELQLLVFYIFFTGYFFFHFLSMLFDRYSMLSILIVTV